jgi:hypothetical protein
LELHLECMDVVAARAKAHRGGDHRRACACGGLEAAGPVPARKARKDLKRRVSKGFLVGRCDAEAALGCAQQHVCCVVCRAVCDNRDAVVLLVPWRRQHLDQLRDTSTST